jgi:hypothetical protein
MTNQILTFERDPSDEVISLAQELGGKIGIGYKQFHLIHSGRKL